MVVFPCPDRPAFYTNPSEKPMCLECPLENCGTLESVAVQAGGASRLDVVFQVVDEDRKCAWSHVFILFTMDRPFRLYAETRSIKNRWVSCLNEVVK